MKVLDQLFFNFRPKVRHKLHVNCGLLIKSVKTLIETLDQKEKDNARVSLGSKIYFVDSRCFNNTGVYVVRNVQGLTATPIWMIMFTLPISKPKLH